MARAHLADVFQALNEGGCVRFVHLSCDAYVIYGDGHRRLIDGRSYHGFLTTMADKIVRTETGNIDDHTLIIEWRRP